MRKSSGLSVEKDPHFNFVVYCCIHQNDLVNNRKHEKLQKYCFGIVLTTENCNNSCFKVLTTALHPTTGTCEHHRPEREVRSGTQQVDVALNMMRKGCILDTHRYLVVVISARGIPRYGNLNIGN